MSDFYFGTVGIVETADYDNDIYKIRPDKEVVVYTDENDIYYYDLFDENRKYVKDIHLCRSGDLYILPESLLTLDDFLKREDEKDRKKHEMYKYMNKSRE